LNEFLFECSVSEELAGQHLRKPQLKQLWVSIGSIAVFKRDRNGAKNYTGQNETKVEMGVELGVGSWEF